MEAKNGIVPVSGWADSRMLLEKTIKVTDYYDRKTGEHVGTSIHDEAGKVINFQPPCPAKNMGFIELPERWPWLSRFSPINPESLSLDLEISVPAIVKTLALALRPPVTPNP